MGRLNARRFFAQLSRANESIRRSPTLQESLTRNGRTIPIETSVHIERHYAVTEIAEMWNLSVDKVRELFENEPGVLVIGERIPRTRGNMSLCAFLKLCSNGSLSFIIEVRRR